MLFGRRRSATMPGAKPEPWCPDGLEWHRAILLGLTFIAIAITSEVVLFYSDRNSGFDLDLINRAETVTKQFFKSFGPSAIMTQLFLWFKPSYDGVKILQPYFDMATRGDGVSAQDSILIDYVSMEPFPAFFYSLKKGHLLVALLSFITFYSEFYSSLAGAYFHTIPVFRPAEVTVNVSGRVGLEYDSVKNLFIPFVGAAGNLGTAFRNHYIYSPNFYWESKSDIWMVPSFNLANSSNADRNGTIQARFSAAMVQARCAGVPASNITVTDPTRASNGNYVIQGTLGDGCVALSYANPNESSTWYGWADPAPPGCVQAINPHENRTIGTDPTEKFFWPVAMSFLKNKTAVSMALCYSTLTENTVDASITFGNGSNHGISDVQNPGDASWLGWGASGLWFTTTATDYRVQGISDAIAFVLTDAVVQMAGYSGSGLNTSLQDHTLSDAGLTAAVAEEAYALYQVLIAPSTLVGASSYQQTATYQINTFRHVAIKPVAHLLAVLCALAGFTLIGVFIYHRRALRPKIPLYADPSKVGAVAALLSRTTFPADAHLEPTDTTEDIEEKLKESRFRLLPDGGIDVTTNQPADTASTEKIA